MSIRRNLFTVFVLLLGVTALDGERLPIRLYTSDDGHPSIGWSMYQPDPFRSTSDLPTTLDVSQTQSGDV